MNGVNGVKCSALTVKLLTPGDGINLQDAGERQAEDAHCEDDGM